MIQKSISKRVLRIFVYIYQHFLFQTYKVW